MVGPTIANRLRSDPNKEEIAKMFFTNYIEKSVLSIEEGKINTAINIYMAMTLALANHYDYPLPINITEIENVDFRTLGHGYVRQRKKPVVNQ